MNYKDIICFDFETTGKDPATCEIIQIAAVHIHPRRLSLGETFQSYLKPLEFDKIEPEALKVNKISIETLQAAPDPKQVFIDFVNFVNKFNSKKTTFFAPVPCGYNIKGYDLPILQRYAERYGFVDKNGKQNIFNNFNQLDVIDFIFHWSENSNEPENMKLDTVRQWLGLDTEGAHNAIVDTKQTAQILVMFLKMYRKQFPKVGFKDALKHASL